MTLPRTRVAPKELLVAGKEEYRDVPSKLVQIESRAAEKRLLLKARRHHQAFTMSSFMFGHPHISSSLTETHSKVVHGKKSCAETVYAAELVKSGVYF